MILSLIFVVLIFGVALAQSTHGFFSALIMTVLTLCCCAAAVGFHDYVAVNYLAEYWKPDFAHPLALGLLFGIPLLLLRLAFDNLIKRSCLLPAWIDRIGAGICGLVTSLVVVGMMAVCVEMVPFGSEGFLGFSRVPAVTMTAAMAKDAPPVNPDARESELWLMPDRFALAAASLMSGGVFSDERAFYADYPDYVRAIGWTNSAPLGVSRSAKPKSISIVSTEAVPNVFRETWGPPAGKERGPSTYEPIEPKGGHEFRVLRVALSGKARDERKSHVFTLRQFRLVGKDASGLPVQYSPIAMQQQSATDPVNHHVKVLKGRSGDIPVVDEPVGPRDTNDQVEVVFELPKGLVPSFLEYKLGSRAAVSFTQSAPRPSGGEAAPPPTPAPSGSTETNPAEAPAPSGRRPRGGGSNPTPSNPPTGNPAPSSGSAGETVPNSGRGGNVRGATALSGQSGFSDALPLEMKDYRQLKDTQIERSTLKNGHLVGEVEKQGSGSAVPVRKFEVPEDKRLLQLHTQKLQARSGLGRAMTFASSTVQSYTVTDALGNQYPVVGKYGIANVNGTRYVEVQYFPEQTQLVGGFGKFDRIKDDDLKGDYQFVLLFLVDPGKQIVGFSTGGSASRADDLTEENLVAPK